MNFIQQNTLLCDRFKEDSMQKRYDVPKTVHYMHVLFVMREGNLQRICFLTLDERSFGSFCNDDDENVPILLKLIGENENCLSLPASSLNEKDNAIYHTDKYTIYIDQLVSHYIWQRQYNIGKKQARMTKNGNKY
ncbi:hypothetical protein T07_5952 [Trichinella nelsoni]|uniref:Uncharacterized protein n=1 Tax=Trichinella nelsoni TaxID=6336 RepID=A0A0V0SD38_9BILA|nr:hypothetical protein T07_5952 [Trichinella nelsoni]